MKDYITTDIDVRCCDLRGNILHNIAKQSTYKSKLFFRLTDTL